MNKEKQAFEGTEDTEIQESNKKLKLDSKKSRFTKQTETKNNFQQLASETHGQILNRQQQAFELGRRFLELLKDKTLPENKGPLNSSIESEILNSLIKFAIEANNEEEQEGMGSIALITLLFKSSLIVRDNYNKLDYRLEQIEKQLKSSKV